MADQATQDWNSLYASLLLIYHKLDELGFQYIDDKVIYIELETEDV
jgi:hypothetical protein